MTSAMIIRFAIDIDGVQINADKRSGADQSLIFRQYWGGSRRTWQPVPLTSARRTVYGGLWPALLGRFRKRTGLYDGSSTTMTVELGVAESTPIT